MIFTWGNYVGKWATNIVIYAQLHFREYPAKRYKRKRHNSALEKDISNLKKVLESTVKTILSCSDTL